MKNILCVRWGDKYNDHVEKLKQQVETRCSLDYKFFCLTDKPKYSYDIQLPTTWDHHFDPVRNGFWAYRKCYMFNEDLFPQLDGDEFVYLDQDILIHNSIDSLFLRDTNNPWIVRGWWNDTENCKKNYGKIKSTPLNSSIIRWNRGQLKPVYDHINDHADYIFFTYSTIDNYFNHFWYNLYDEFEAETSMLDDIKKGESTKKLFRGFEQGIAYSWYKGNIFPEDMDLNKVRTDNMICLFNNSYSINAGKTGDEHMYEIDEVKKLWNI